MRTMHMRTASPFIALGALLLAATGCANAPAPGTGPSTEPSAGPTTSLAEVGDCFTFLDGASNPSLSPCDQEHFGEVFHEVPYGDGSSDVTALIAQAEEQCVGEAFTAFIGRPHPESELGVSMIYADGDGVRAPEGSLLCTVGPMEGMVTGTLKGADR